jgi:hypothetical protein
MPKHIKTLIVSSLAALSALPSTASADMVLSPSSQVVRIQSYTDFASGDVFFELATSTPGCVGFWLQPNDPGFKQTHAVLMMAKATQMNVVAYAYDNQLWSGSSYAYCRVRSLTAE